MGKHLSDVELCRIIKNVKHVSINTWYGTEYLFYIYFNFGRTTLLQQVLFESISFNGNWSGL